GIFLFALLSGTFFSRNYLSLWIDRLDIPAGTRWDNTIEEALEVCQGLIVLLSKTSVESENVLDEVSYALGGKKKVIPVLLEPCDMPFRLKRLQYIDLFTNYEVGVSRLVRDINLASDLKNKFHNKAKSYSPYISSQRSQPQDLSNQVKTAKTKTSFSQGSNFQNIVKKPPSAGGETLINEIPRSNGYKQRIKFIPADKKILVISILGLCLTLSFSINQVSRKTSFLMPSRFLSGDLAPQTKIEYISTIDDHMGISEVLNSQEIRTQFDVYERTPQSYGGAVTDTIRFGTAVDESQVRLLAQRLIREKVPIKVIYQHDSLQGKQANFIVLGQQKNFDGTSCSQVWTKRTLKSVTQFDKYTDSDNLSGCVR
ncbi:MAG: toll/interleukin-1 receptor domain-containing protein, partial [Cyanobacteria bacterium J06597_16]